MRFDSGFPPGKPRAAKGGIKARSKRGAFATRWWAKRWIAALESLSAGARLQRGRKYARDGQVLDIAIAPGIVTAHVQGSLPEPYRVTIRVAMLPPAVWFAIASRIAAEARFTAALLSGEMPHDIDTVFLASGASLFPATLRELRTECSCPDLNNPCKHIAATYYLLGEEFDRDPFLLFVLRGSTKEQLFAELRRDDIGPPPKAEVPLPKDLTAFWGAESTVESAAHESVPPRAHTRALPAFPFWRGAEPLDTLLARVDTLAVEQAIAILADAADR